MCLEKEVRLKNVGRFVSSIKENKTYYESKSERRKKGENSLSPRTEMQDDRVDRKELGRAA